jgi:signal transduction histidine kinase
MASLGSLVLLTAAVFVLSYASIKFTRTSDFIPSLWPSNAIVLVALIRAPGPWRSYFLILAAAWIAIFAANALAGNGPVLSAQLAAADIVEAAFALILLASLGIRSADFTRLRPLSIFVLVCALAPLFGATLGATAVTHVHATAFSKIWAGWYASHALGMIIVGPLLLTVDHERLRSLQIEKRYVESCSVLMLVLLVSVLASYYRAFIFAVIPVILIAILRFRLIGGAVATLVFALVGIYFIINEIGSPVLRQATTSERMLALQILLATIALWSFPVASILTERDSLLQALDLANSRLRADNEEKSRMVTDLRRSLLNVEEQERLHLSHELHDQTGQPLAAALLELSAIEKQPGNADRDRMQRLRSRIEEIMQAVHRIAWQLRPAAINELGLASALGDYVAEWSQRFGITADFQCSDMKLDELSDEIRMTIYRVLGEALNNVAKHAQGCTAVSVLINRAHSRLQLIVEDDGCGFDPKGRDGTSARPTNGGLGLAGMRERLMFVGGELEIESAPGAGTTIFARIQV